ncbi:transcription factor bHLH167-like [Prosopis cineraria]|uniref:transcription factor bHLH167-like n=1 Tax=Prosopis cineraria TaxID=364024 RepID=UPI002410A8E1|nr:transcription factor bHLH167-like [Prosopis cineraria]
MERFRTVSVTPLLPLVSDQVPPSSSSDEPVVVVAMAETGKTPGKRASSTQMGGLERSDLVLERDRRMKMSHMFNELQSTVPGLFPKATREVIVNETINYIKDLEKKKKRLEELKGLIMEPEEAGGKLMLPCSSNKNSSITVSVSGNVAFFGVQSKARFGLITMIFKVFYKHNAEILAANVSVNNGELTLAITALLVNDDGNVIAEKIKREILGL